jgi:hypothetical protein
MVLNQFAGPPAVAEVPEELSGHAENEVGWYLPEFVRVLTPDCPPVRRISNRQRSNLCNNLRGGFFSIVSVERLTHHFSPDKYSSDIL